MKKDKLFEDFKKYKLENLTSNSIIGGQDPSPGAQCTGHCWYSSDESGGTKEYYMPTKS